METTLTHHCCVLGEERSEKLWFVSFTIIGGIFPSLSSPSLLSQLKSKVK